MKAILTLERYTKNYRLLEKKQMLSRSFTKGFIQFLYVLHSQPPSGAPYSMNDIGNSSRNLCCAQWSNSRSMMTHLRTIAGGGGGSEICYNMGTGGSSGDGYMTNIGVLSETLGIVIGSGTNAVTPTDVALQTRIVNGKDSGKLDYGGSEVNNLVVSNPNGSFDLKRFFTNNSGGDVTVNECGIYACGNYPSSTLGYSGAFCIARDLVSPGIVIANTQILRVVYTLQITV